jgi:hypothetical protein
MKFFIDTETTGLPNFRIPVADASNSGIGFKPEFSGVPMTKQIHALQH